MLDGRQLPITAPDRYRQASVANFRIGTLVEIVPLLSRDTRIAAYEVELRW